MLTEAQPLPAAIGEHGCPWPPLVRGRLVKRYQRFIAEVDLDDGPRVKAHCPNTGSMTGCCEPGRPVYLSHHPLARRKLKYTWELIEMPDSLVGVNTVVPNRLAYQAACSQLLSPLAGYREVVREAGVGRHTRFDLLLQNSHGDRCFVEVKNCTLVQDGIAYFPDAVTVRGRKHLQVLQNLRQAGDRAVMLYLIQRTDARGFAPARQVDPDYAAELERAVAAGVEVLACDVQIDLQRIALNRLLPVYLGPGTIPAAGAAN